jgi:dihydroxy-acid dehydratase
MRRAEVALLRVELGDDEPGGSPPGAWRCGGLRRRLGGLLEKYAAVVGPAHLGALTHSGVPEDEL